MKVVNQAGAFVFVLMFSFFAKQVKSQTFESAASSLVSSFDCNHLSQNSFDCNQFEQLVVWHNSRSFNLDLFLRNMWSNSSFSLTLPNRSENVKSVKAKFGVFISDNEEQFLKIFNSKHYDINGFYVIVLAENKFNRSLVFDTMWSLSFYNVDILTRNKDGSIDLLTFFPFRKHFCRSVRSVSINKFIGNAWTSQTFFPLKLQDFQKCPIRLTSHTVVGRVEPVKYSNGTVGYKGVEMTILEAIGEALNFDIKVDMRSSANGFGKIYENGTATGVIGHLLHGHADGVVGYFISRVRLLYLDISSPYEYHSVIAVVPQGAPFTSIENLIRPFTPIVWIAFFIVIVVACAFMFALKFFKIRKNFPYHNLLMIEVGVAVKILPRNNSARILIMSFVMFCLVVRTSYQSKMFNFLQSGQNKRMMKSLAEMQEQKFNLYLLSGLDHVLDGLLKYPKRWEETLSTKHYNKFNKTFPSTVKRSF